MAIIRAVGYSRYSTDLQNELSIEDQQALISRYALANGMTIQQFYSDAAQSGASIFRRDGLLQLLADAREGLFDVVIVEELDRLARDMEDLAGIHKRLTFAGIEIRAVHEGVANTVTVGLRGLVGQLFREDNARKIRRGMTGNISRGRTAGGRAFGYRPHPTERGELVIVPEEAEIIRRIFREFADGRSAVEIAHGLTKDKCPMPRGARAWQASTIYGWAERRSGILRNDLYVGRIVWNKTRFVTDPETGRRVSRSNPVENWLHHDAPHLRIIDDAVWDQVQAMITPDRTTSHSDRAKMRRPTRPLSGLLRCGACGGGMSVKGKDRSGRVRIGCTRHVQSRTCPKPRTWYLDVVEEQVIGLLRGELQKPAMLDLYVSEYNKARAEYAAGMLRRRSRLETRIKQLDAEVSRLIDFVARGIGNTDRLAADYEARCEELAAAKAELEDEPPAITPVMLHPAALVGYRLDLAKLAKVMGTDTSSETTRYAEILRGLIETVTISETARGQMEITVAGKLRALIDAPTLKRRLSGGAVVAEEGLEPPTRGL